MQVSEAGIRQRLVGFTMAKSDLVPDEGLLVVNPSQNGHRQIVGWVTSSRLSPTLGKAIGLCWLPAEVAGTDIGRHRPRVRAPHSTDRHSSQPQSRRRPIGIARHRAMQPSLGEDDVILERETEEVGCDRRTTPTVYGVQAGSWI